MLRVVSLEVCCELSYNSKVGETMLVRKKRIKYILKMNFRIKTNLYRVLFTTKLVTIITFYS